MILLYIYIAVLLITCPWQQWFHGSVSLLHLYVYCLSLSMLHKKCWVLKGLLLSNFRANFVYYWQNIFKCYFIIQTTISTFQLFLIFKKGKPKHNWNILKIIEFVSGSSSFIIRSFSVYTQQWYMSYRFADSLLSANFTNSYNKTNQMHYFSNLFLE